MTKKKETAMDLIRELEGDDPEIKAMLEEERVNLQIAQMIYDARAAAGLTQAQLAEIVGTSQSAIARLEDADYEGHSLTMLPRIGDALNQRIEVRFVPRASERKAA